MSRARLALACLALASWLCACAPSANIRTKARADEPLTFYYIAASDGDDARAWDAGFADAVAWINKTGGLRGATVQIARATEAAYERLRARKPLLLFSDGTADALAARLTQDRIPMLAVGASSSALDPQGYVFHIGPTEREQFALFAAWLSANWQTLKPSRAQAERPALLILDDGALARSAEARALVEQQGLRWLPALSAAPGDVSAARAQMSEAQRMGAQAIFLDVNPPSAARFASAWKDAGLRDQMLVALRGDSLRVAADGWYGVLPFRDYGDAEHDGIKLVTLSLQENQRSAELRRTSYLLGFAVADAGRQLLEQTIDRVGFDALSAAEVFKTLSAVSEVQALDGVLLLSYGDARRASQSARVVQRRGDQLVSVSEWLRVPAQSK